MKIVLSFFVAFSIVLFATLGSFAHEGGDGGAGGDGGYEHFPFNEVQILISQQSDYIRTEINRLLAAAHREISVLKAKTMGGYLELNELMLAEKFDREKALKIIEGIAENKKRIDTAYMDFLMAFKALFKNENDKSKVNLFIANNLLHEYFHFLIASPKFKMLQFPGLSKQDGDKTKEKGKKSDEIVCIPAKQ